MRDAILSDWTPDEREDFLRAMTRFNDTVDGWIVRDENGCRLAQRPARRK